MATQVVTKRPAWLALLKKKEIQNYFNIIKIVEWRSNCGAYAKNVIYITQ